LDNYDSANISLSPVAQVVLQYGLKSKQMRNIAKIKK